MTSFGGETPTVKITIPDAKTQVVPRNIPNSVKTSQHKQFNI